MGHAAEKHNLCDLTQQKHMSLPHSKFMTQDSDLEDITVACCCESWPWERETGESHVGFSLQWPARGTSHFRGPVTVWSHEPTHKQGVHEIGVQ